MSCYPVWVQRRRSVSVRETSTHSNTQGWGLVFSMSVKSTSTYLQGLQQTLSPLYFLIFCQLLMCICALSQTCAMHSIPHHHINTRPDHPNCAATSSSTPLHWHKFAFVDTMSEQHQAQPTCDNINCPHLFSFILKKNTCKKWDTSSNCSILWSLNVISFILCCKTKNGVRTHLFSISPNEAVLRPVRNNIEYHSFFIRGITSSGLTHTYISIQALKATNTWVCSPFDGLFYKSLIYYAPFRQLSQRSYLAELLVLHIKLSLLDVGVHAPTG